MRKNLLLILVAGLLTASMILTGSSPNDRTPTASVAVEPAYDHEIQGFHSFEMTAGSP